MIVRIRRSHRGARFIHPLDAESRTAILAPGFQETRLVRVFPQGWDKSAERFAPASVAGPLEQLRSLAHIGRPLEDAVIGFTYQADSGVSPADRELFWEAFGVPLFQQYLGSDNELLATECDAHSGLHVVAGCEGLDLEHDLCACGNPAPRLTRRGRIEELAELLV